MPDLFSTRFLITTFVALLLLLVIGAVAARARVSGRSRSLAAALEESVRGRLVFTRGPNAAGFGATIQPPPEPFFQFQLECWPAAPLDVFGTALGAARGQADRLIFTARLPTRPAAELVWSYGQSPARALARRDRATLWVQRRLDIVDAEYVVRGANTGAIEHVFFDLQARFRPLLLQISVQADAEPEVRVVLRTRELNAQNMPGLVISLRALGARPC